MTLAWIKERPAVWDADKLRIVGGAPAGCFDAAYAQMTTGDPLPGEWWRVEDDGRSVGYGWLDVVWGDAEILLATDREQQGRGIGSFAVARLEDEARQRGIHHLYNTVPPAHPAPQVLIKWLIQRGFHLSEDGTLRLQVARADGTRPPG